MAHYHSPKIRVATFRPSQKDWPEWEVIFPVGKWKSVGSLPKKSKQDVFFNKVFCKKPAQPRTYAFNPAVATAAQDLRSHKSRDARPTQMAACNNGCGFNLLSVVSYGAVCEV